MGERIHDHEPDTSEATLRALLAAERPEWAGRPLEYLRTSGTDNAMWRIGDDVVARLPRRPGSAAGMEAEVAVLRALASTSLPSRVRVPTVRHVGSPLDGTYPHRWVVLDWIDGIDAWTSVAGPTALDLAEVVLAIGALEGMPAPPRTAGERGGPLEPMVRVLARALDDPRWDAPARVDVAAVRRLAAEGLEADPPPADRFVHGDLIPGNLLVDDGGRLTAVIDWGSAGWGDPAQDLAPAWAVLDRRGRASFRAAVGVDDATWIRGRTIELAHAVTGVLYYVPRRHPLGDVMARTLGRILEDG